MVINRQDKLRIDVAGARAFAARLGIELKLGARHFNVCLVDDDAIRELNGDFRNKPQATDVLSFAWTGPRPESSPSASGEFNWFLGDVVISVETARRNARLEGHSTAAEIRWLILHGVLHLLGMDHETDHGEMESRELELRARLGLNGSKGVSRTPGRRPRAARRAPAADSPGRKSSGLRNGRRAAGPAQV